MKEILNKKKKWIKIGQWYPQKILLLGDVSRDPWEKSFYQFNYYM